MSGPNLLLVRPLARLQHGDHGGVVEDAETSRISKTLVHL